MILDASEQFRPSHSLHGSLEIIRHLLHAGLPTLVTSITTFLYDLISLYFVGHLNDPHILASIGFSLTWIDAFGVAIVFGVAAGFGTLASHAYGAGKYETLGIIYQRIWILMGLVILAITGFMFSTSYILLFIGFEHTIVEEVSYLVVLLIPAVIGHAFFQIMRFYLMAIGKYEVSAIIGVCIDVLHIGSCYFFIEHLGMKQIGVCIARSISEIVAALAIYVYLKWTNPCPESMFSWRRRALRGLPKFAIEIFTHGTTVYIETITFQITAVITGLLRNKIILAAHTVTLNFLYVAIMPLYGVSLSLNTLIGNAAGEGNHHRAKHIFIIGLICNYAQAGLLFTLILFGRPWIAEFYTGELETQSFIIKMLALYCIGLFGDAGSNTMGFSLRALGQDKYVFKSFVFAYYFVGVSLSYILGIIYELGYSGIWYGLVIGYWTMFILMLYKVITLDWNDSTRMIQMNLHEQTILTELELESIEHEVDNNNNTENILKGQ